MNLNDFFAKLPHQVTNLLGAYELEKAVAALPDDLFKALADAVVARYQAEQLRTPNAEEIALWHEGKRPQAATKLRARTGLALKDAVDLLRRGLLTNMTYAIFFTPEKKSEPEGPPS